HQRSPETRGAIGRVASCSFPACTYRVTTPHSIEPLAGGTQSSAYAQFGAEPRKIAWKRPNRFRYKVSGRCTLDRRKFTSGPRGGITNNGLEIFIRRAFRRRKCWRGMRESFIPLKSITLFIGSPKKKISKPGRTRSLRAFCSQSKPAAFLRTSNA